MWLVATTLENTGLESLYKVLSIHIITFRVSGEQVSTMHSTYR